LLGSLGPRAPFFAAAILSLINFSYGFFVLPESLPAERRRAFQWKRANPLGTLMQMKKHPVVVALLLSLFLWAVANQVMPTTWAFYTKLRFGWSEAIIGASLAVAGAAMITSQAVLVRFILPKLGERGTAIAGMLGGVASYLAFGLATTGWMMFAAISGWLLGALVMPTVNALASHRIARDAQGELQGAAASLFSLAAILGPPLMTHLFARFTSDDARFHVPGAAFFAAALLAIGCLLIFWFSTRETIAEPTAAATTEPKAA
jgi:DHA1 family tetracycline resistance protein-like MFS transporter